MIFELLVTAFVMFAKQEPEKVCYQPKINYECEEEPQAQYMRITCYCWTGNHTASGVWPEVGMCASNWAHMGWTAHVFSPEWEYVGSYLVTDVGGASTLLNGTSIDVYCDTLADCYEYIAEHGDYGYVIWEEPIESEE